MSITAEELGDTVYVLRKLADACGDSNHPAAIEAHNAFVAAQSYTAALAVELDRHADLRAAIDAALDGCRRTGDG